MEKEVRSYYGALVVFALIILLLVFLAFVKIPSENNDVFKLMLGVIAGSLSVIMYTIVGKDNDEVHKLKLENESLLAKNRALTERVDHLERMFMDLQEKVIDKLSIIQNEKNSI